MSNEELKTVTFEELADMLEERKGYEVDRVPEGESELYFIEGPAVVIVKRQDAR